MKFEWDEKKRQINIKKHDIDFVDAARVLLRAPQVHEDTRRDYGEPRYLAYGFWQDALLVLVFTIRGEYFRIISARRANARERRAYEARQKAKHNPSDY